MVKKYFLFFSVFLLLPLRILVIPDRSIKAQAVTVNCPLYCASNFPSYPVGGCYTNDPGFYCTSTNLPCSSDPTKICYCCTETLPTPTCVPNFYSCDSTDPDMWCCNSENGYICYNGYCQIYSTPTPTVTPMFTPTSTPTYSVCTVYPGTDPCNQYNCGDGSCETHGGVCYEGYCYPANCVCGESQSYCPYGYTCQTSILPYTCDANDINTICRPGVLNCTLGAAGVPCNDSASCIYECGDDPDNPIVYCSGGICYLTSTCGGIQDGPGTCMPADNCPDDLERGQIDCITGEICCAPAPDTCTGIFGNPGECSFLKCPPNTYFEGFNPPYDDIGCPLLYACCTQPSAEWIERHILNPVCTTPSGEVGIKTAVGCISVTSSTGFLTFILPWAISVGGATAFILIVVAGFLVMTSAGNPQRAKAGKDLMGAAIAGLLMIIFSVYLLDLIGIRIFRIPGI